MFSPLEQNKANQISWEQRLLKNAGRVKSSLKPEYQELKFTLHRKLVDKINLEALATIDNQRVRGEVRQALISLIDNEPTLLSSLEKQQISEEVLDEVFGLGPLDQLVDMLPKMGPLQNLPKDAKVDEGQLKRVEAIINSMTNQERRDHNVLDGKRRKRIAAGSGTTVQDVNQVIKQYMQMRQMMKQYGALAARSKMKGLGKLAGLS